MREFSVPPTAAVSDEENLTDVVWANAERFASSVSFRRRVDGGWTEVTARDFADQVVAVAKGLLAAGIERGDRVALMSRTRFEWTVLDYAIWATGAATIPLYHTSCSEHVEWVLSDSGAKAVIVETAAHRELLEGLRDRLGEITGVWQIEPAPDGSGPAAAIDELTALGAGIADEAVRERAASVGADDMATLVYTSGTTGRPKGCELTHRNLLAQTRAAVAVLPRFLRPGNSVLLFLPLAHLFARIAQCCAVYARVTLGHSSDVAGLAEDLREFRPTFLFAVPRVFEKIYSWAWQQAHREGRGRIFDSAAATAITWSRALDQGGPGAVLRLRHALFEQLVYARLRAVLGGRCAAAVCAGAPLGERLGHFFRGIGVPVLEGYGLTESSAICTVNTEQQLRVGTAGRPVPGVSVRVEDNGEVLVKGPGVLRGYWRDPAGTMEALWDGWLRTGDLGELDEDGYLRIIGRRKDILTTASGRAVVPALLEDRLRAHPLVSHCVVVGDRQPFVAALITLDTDALPTWAARHGKGADVRPADLVDDAELVAALQAAVNDANQAVPKTETIRRFRVLAEDFAERDGLLTPTLKVRRSVVEKEFAAEIDALYAS